jgi:hypothetical protein
MTPDQLSFETCIAVLSDVGQKYVKNIGYEPRTVSSMIEAMVRSEVPKTPGWLSQPEDHVDDFGPIARRVLKDMLASEDDRLRDLVNRSITQYEKEEGHIIIEMMVGGGILIGLAVISKIKYSKDRGWELEPGFPGLADVLDKAGNLIGKLNPVSSAG